MAPIYFRRSLINLAVLLGILSALPVGPAAAQGMANNSIQISWEVRNRFRLFREERDFQLHVDAMRNRSVLAAERRTVADVMSSHLLQRIWILLLYR